MNKSGKSFFYGVYFMVFMVFIFIVLNLIWLLFKFLFLVS